MQPQQPPRFYPLIIWGKRFGDIRGNDDWHIVIRTAPLHVKKDKNYELDEPEYLKLVDELVKYYRLLRENDGRILELANTPISNKGVYARGVYFLPDYNLHVFLDCQISPKRDSAGRPVLMTRFILIDKNPYSNALELLVKAQSKLKPAANTYAPLEKNLEDEGYESDDTWTSFPTIDTLQPQYLAELTKESSDWKWLIYALSVLIDKEGEWTGIRLQIPSGENILPEKLTDTYIYKWLRCLYHLLPQNLRKQCSIGMGTIGAVDAPNLWIMLYPSWWRITDASGAISKVVLIEPYRNIIINEHTKETVLHSIPLPHTSISENSYAYWIDQNYNGDLKQLTIPTHWGAEKPSRPAPTIRVLSSSIDDSPQAPPSEVATTSQPPTIPSKSQYLSEKPTEPLTQLKDWVEKKFGLKYDEQKGGLFLIAVALVVAIIVTLAIILNRNNQVTLPSPSPTPTQTKQQAPTQTAEPNLIPVVTVIPVILQTNTPSPTPTPKMGGGVLLVDTRWYIEPDLDSVTLEPNLSKDIFVIITEHQTDETNHRWYKVTAGGVAGWVRAFRDDETQIINANEYINANESSYTQGIPTFQVTATLIHTLTPTSTPTVTPPPIQRPPCQATHIVKANETLFTIILLYPPVPSNLIVASKEIAEASGFSDPNTLKIGQSLCIPFFTD